MIDHPEKSSLKAKFEALRCAKIAFATLHGMIISAIVIVANVPTEHLASDEAMQFTALSSDETVCFLVDMHINLSNAWHAVC